MTISRYVPVFGRLDLVAAVGAGLHGRFTAGGDVAQHHAGARHDRAGRVRHDTGHGGGERRGGRDDRGEEEQNNTHERLQKTEPAEK